MLNELTFILFCVEHFISIVNKIKSQIYTLQFYSTHTN